MIHAHIEVICGYKFRDSKAFHQCETAPVFPGELTVSMKLAKFMHQAGFRTTDNYQSPYGYLEGLPVSAEQEEHHEQNSTTLPCPHHTKRSRPSPVSPAGV